MLTSCSVTRFGNMSAIWLNFKRLWPFLRVYLVFGKILYLLWQIFKYLCFWTNFHGIKWPNNLAIRSRCHPVFVLLITIDVIGTIARKMINVPCFARRLHQINFSTELATHNSFNKKSKYINYGIFSCTWSTATKLKYINYGILYCLHI